METGVYVIRNTASGRVYVGASKNISARLQAHKSHLRHSRHHSASLQADWTAASGEGFEFDTLELVSDPALVSDRERYWIALIGSSDPTLGYNSNLGSPGSPGVSRVFSPEHKSALAEANRRKWSNPDFKIKTSAAISKSKVGKRRGPHTPERRAKIAEANRARAHLQVGVPLSNETRRKMSACRVGKRHSAETRLKMKLSALARNQKLTGDAP